MRSIWHSDVPPFKVISNSDVDTLPKFSFRRDTDEKIEPCYSKAKKNHIRRFVGTNCTSPWFRFRHSISDSPVMSMPPCCAPSPPILQLL